jgi:multiple sugar transport system substrate-binding protein
MPFITRRNALQLGTAVPLLGAGGAFAQSKVQIANVAAPNLPIENGATLRMLRPVKFVQPDEDIWRANCARFTQRTGVQVRVDFVGWEDINQQTAVTANTGAGPDLIIGFSDAPHIYADKLIELSDIAEYLGKKYGGWMYVGEKYGKRHGTNNWIGLPFGGTAGPLVWRKSAIESIGLTAPPADLPTLRAPVGFDPSIGIEERSTVDLQRGPRRSRPDDESVDEHVSDERANEDDDGDDRG